MVIANHFSNKLSSSAPFGVFLSFGFGSPSLSLSPANSVARSPQLCPQARFGTLTN